ncbi:MAG TPA: DUF5946 family protein [Thermomicrobiales bacterium]|nr:DUF5946 family protein [Thermomicrobiales bacterium]
MNEPGDADIEIDSAPPAEPASCPECGATPVDGVGCRGMLGRLLAWEVDDPELAAAHFLTVASYNVQHPAWFTDDAITGLRSMLVDALDRHAPPSALRRRAGRMFAGKSRVRRDPSERQPVLRRWDTTVHDVVAPGPVGAAMRVRAWASAIRREL